MLTIDLIYFDAGGGHRSAATALSLAVERQGRPWRMRMVNLQDVLDRLDIFRKITGIRLQDLYNLLLTKGWTLGSAFLLPLMHAIIRLYHPAQVRLLSEHWRQTEPDMVVSLVPNFNRALFQSLEKWRPGVPFVTILTDFADYPPHFWIERQAQFLVCGTEKAVEQARAIGYPPERIYRASGMILQPRFYDAPEVDVGTERMRLGLQRDLPTGLVMFGGQGSTVMIEIFERLQRCPRDLQLILICGRNEKLAGRLRGAPGRLPRFVEGFTTEIPYYMRLSDFFIGKPGPGSISEALRMSLPVIVERSSFTLPQERYNAEWIREKDVGVVIPNFRGIADTVAWLLKPSRLAAFQARAAAIENRAVFEIPDMLAEILRKSGKG